VFKEINQKMNNFDIMEDLQSKIAKWENDISELKKGRKEKTSCVFDLVNEVRIRSETVPVQIFILLYVQRSIHTFIMILFIRYTFISSCTPVHKF
jgi:hypothetical protein